MEVTVRVWCEPSTLPEGRPEFWSDPQNHERPWRPATVRLASWEVAEGIEECLKGGVASAMAERVVVSPVPAAEPEAEERVPETGVHGDEGLPRQPVGLWPRLRQKITRRVNSLRPALVKESRRGKDGAREGKERRNGRYLWSKVKALF
jgi:hypothetical protein